MNGFDTYQQLAMRTAKPMEVQDELAAFRADKQMEILE